MDSNTSGFLLNSSTLQSVYYQAKEDDGIIDLGLSLRALQPEACHPSGNCMPFSLYAFFGCCYVGCLYKIH
jgi:auxin-responsive protein IAA